MLAELESALDKSWDGAWYKRAYFDDGSPLGSSHNPEGRIDAIAQAWAVISRAGSTKKARQAMQSVQEQLVKLDEGIIMVLTPPFNTSEPDPGYIRGYPPGIRENGGQYTHAAPWTVMATALLGDGDAAYAMFSTLSPIHHTRDQSSAERYKTEPFVVVADVYSTPPHIGRGGWSWYTGSASWMQRTGIETLLGLCIEGEKLIITPCIPSAWDKYAMTIVWKTAHYQVNVHNPEHICHGTVSLSLDGHPMTDGQPIILKDDGNTHNIECVIRKT